MSPGRDDGEVTCAPAKRFYAGSNPALALIPEVAGENPAAVGWYGVVRNRKV